MSDPTWDDTVPTWDDTAPVNEGKSKRKIGAIDKAKLIWQSLEVASETLPQNIAYEATLGKGSEKIAEGLGARGYPKSGAALGTAAYMAPQIYSGLMMPGPNIAPKTAFLPKVPPARAGAVGAAQEMGVPLTRAEMTGNKFPALVETAAEKSMTGSGVIQKFRQRQAEALERVTQEIKSKFGTGAPPSSSGQEAQLAMQETIGGARNLARQLYKDVPDVPIATPRLSKTLDDIASGQATVADPKVAQVVEQVRSQISRSAGPTEGTFPTPLGTTGESQYRVGPTPSTPPATPKFQQLNEIRNFLNKEIASETTFNPIVGQQTTNTGRQIQQIKAALDQDIEQVAKASDPLGKLQGGDFSSKFARAKGFYGEVKALTKSKFVKKLSTAQPSEIAKTIFGPGRIEDVAQAKVVLGKSGYEPVKKQFFNDIIESKNIARELDRYTPEFLEKALTKKELEALRKLDSVKQLARGAEKLAGNPSGTAQVLGSQITMGLLAHAGWKALTSPLVAIGEAATILGLPYLTARSYVGSVNGLKLSGKMFGPLMSKMTSIGKPFMERVDAIPVEGDTSNAVEMLQKRRQ